MNTYSAKMHSIDQKWR